MRFCAACAAKADWLSMHALCAKCQKVKGAMSRRIYDWRTGKRKV